MNLMISSSKDEVISLAMLIRRNLNSNYYSRRSCRFVRLDGKKRGALRRLTIKREMMDAKPLSSLSSQRVPLFFLLSLTKLMRRNLMISTNKEGIVDLSGLTGRKRSLSMKQKEEILHPSFPVLL